MNDDKMGESNGEKNCDMKNETSGRMSDSESDGRMNQQQQLENVSLNLYSISKVGESSMCLQFVS